MPRSSLWMPLALAYLFLATALPANAQSEESEGKETLFDVRSNITLNCALANPDGVPYVWTKNDTNIEQVSDLKGRYQMERGGAELVVQHSVEDDFGNYTCALSGRADPPPQRWTLRGRTFAKLPANSNVVEGQKLKLQCKVVGKPYPRVVWTVSNSTEEEGEGVEVRLALGDRVTLRRSEQGAEDGELVLETVQRSDAGRYACAAPLPGAGAPHRAATTLHVKDMYAALWPFLGICFEVFVLCTIILVYEKRRTKPDLDDSDTDNHDQKKS
ncbi:PREDICTED: basigin [Papilio xuthus]|uniref:Basigin n=1 Tax=Papilio xuthus TaxID=66420 RepID=A0AAJ6Z1D3_PAPXU|nr:PREDICTED: basigin [Papilio xuthus]